MSMVEHLGELRRRLVIAMIAIALGGIVCFVFYNSILEVLQRPYCDVVNDPAQCRLLATAPLDPITLRLQIAGYGGVILPPPLVFLQGGGGVVPRRAPPGEGHAPPLPVLTRGGLFLPGGVRP